MEKSRIIRYLESTKNEKTSKEDIYQHLLAEGATIDEIETVYKEINSNSDREEGQKRVIQIVVTIGAFLIGAGVFSFIAANWRAMPNFFRLLIILMGMTGSYTLGWWMKEKLNYEKTGTALYLLANLIFGGGIFLVAQMFNVRANWPDGFILWMLGSLFAAVLLKENILYLIAFLTAVVALFGHPFVIFNTFSVDPHLLTSTLLLLIATAVTFWIGYRTKNNHV